MVPERTVTCPFWGPPAPIEFQEEEEEEEERLAYFARLRSLSCESIIILFPF